MKNLSDLQFTEIIHSKTNLDLYVKTLFSDRLIGNIDFEQLAYFCIQQTQTPVSQWKAFRRLERLYYLLKFYQLALKTCKANVAECGVFRGLSALALGIQSTELAQNINKSRQMWLIDSYEGLSEPTEEDLVLVTKEEGKEKINPHRAGRFAASLEIVKKNFDGLRNVHFLKGWIPTVFNDLAEQEWSFVHVDVDLYKPVMDCLEYFFPRLEKGGVILNDDFGSPYFPGAGKAWAEFFEKRDLGYVILDTGQAVFINNR